MNKIYQRIDWENYPSSATPLNEDNLNKMDYAIDKLDDRIVTHETTKLNTATGNTLVKNVTFDERTGVFTIEKLNGSKITINTALEKISTNFHFNPTTQKLILTLIDGTTQEIDLSALLTQYEFLESDTITFTIDASGKVKANILNGSITGEKLEPNYLADVTLQANNAKTSANNAKTSEELAYQYAEEARESASQTAKSDAKNITYDNTESGLSATNVKDALDEVAQGSVSAIAIDTTITDSTNAPLVRLKVKGKTEQFTTSGKNLVENTAITQTVGGVTFTVNDDGSVTANGTATEDAILTIWRHPKIKKGGRYILSGNTSEKFMLKLTLAWGGSNHYFTSNGEEIEFTVDGDITTSSLQFIIPSGEKANNFTFYPMIREATITDATYEPFTNGASPNPDYPQEINGLAKDGAIEVKTCGKNLVVNNLTTTTVNGVTFTVNKDGSITANGTATADASVTIWKRPKIEKGKSYILSGGSSDKKNIKLIVAWGGSNHTYTSKGNEVSFTVDGDVTATSITMTISSGETANNFTFYPMIRNTDITDATYEPYTETTAIIPTDAPLYEGDYLEIFADGSGVLHRKMAKVVFDGSSDEEWNKSSEGTIYYTILNDAKYSGSDNNVNNVQGLCSHFTMLDSYSNTIIKGDGYCGFGVVSSLSKTMVGMNSSLTAVNEWKAWLQSNPVTVVCELAEPTETPLTAEQVAQFKKLYTFEPITNVLCDGETEIQYYKNTPSGVAVGTVHRMANDEKAIYDGDGNVITETYVKKKPKYIIIMDSYGNPVIPNGGGTITPFINRLPALMGWSSNDYKASYQDGAGFGNGLFLSQLKTLRNSMTSAEAEEYTNIVVLGGYNDWQQTFISLKSAMQTFCDYAKTNFPNATVKIGYISGSRRAGDRYNLKIVPLNTYRCASLVGAVYLRNLEYVLHDNCYFLTGDNQYQHPLDIGHELLAPFIAEALKTGGCSVARQHTKYKVTFASGITETVALYITSSQVNDQLTIANEVAFMTFNSNKTINDAEYFNIGTLPSECHIIGSYQSYEGNYPITVAYTDSADNSGVCTASIHFNGRTGDTSNVTVQLCLYTGGKTLTLKSICIYANSGLLSSNEC